MSNENPLTRPLNDESYDIRIAHDGTWWHNGAPIHRQGLIKLFASALRRDEGGNFWLVTPAERGMIIVEDAPFVAIEMRQEESGAAQTLSFRTNLDEWVSAGPAHPLKLFPGSTGQLYPYITVKDGLDARLSRSVYYELVALAQVDTARIGVWSQGVFFSLEQQTFEAHFDDSRV